MSETRPLYWTNFKRYEECPQKYLWYRGHPEYDLGAGLGKSKPKTTKKSYQHIIMGWVVGGVIEDFYNLELWRNQMELKHRLKKRVANKLEYYLSKPKKYYVDWNESPPKEELLQVCIDGVLGFLKTLKHNRLLGPYAKSEVELIAHLNNYCPVGGKVDILFHRDDTGFTILDGKNSKEKGKWTDPDQLRWYAMCFLHMKGYKPDRLGFVYFRYPHGTPIKGGEGIHSGVDYIDWDISELKALSHRAQEVSKKIFKKKFAPTPSRASCQWCEYSDKCSVADGKTAFDDELDELEKKIGTSGIIDLDF